MKITRWILSISLLLFSSLLLAGQSIWTFTPVSGFPPTVSVAPGGTATIKYTMTNQSSQTHTLVMTPIAGITQVTTAGNCGNPFILTNHQSCTLTLTVDGNTLPGNITGGPQVCQQGSQLQCYQPNFADSLQITKVANNTAGITVSPSTLALTAYSQTPGYLTVTNTSTSITATNIVATLPPSWTDVSQNASQCVSVAPEESCQLIFTPGNTAYNPESVPIQGSNTTQTSAIISVNAPSTTTLSTSLSTLTLAASGNARQLSITNVGSAPAYDVTYNVSPDLPAGTTISPANCGTLDTSSTCVLTITPGSTASNTPSVLSIQAINALDVTTDLYVLTYGSIYQQGYVFSIDDTTAIDGSIGGTTAALTDNSSGIQWFNGSYTTIGASSLTDGASNTQQIVNTQGIGGYAASVCANYAVDSAGNSPCTTGTCYNNWYLPAICQLGSSSGSAGCASGTPNMLDNLSSLVNSCSGSACLSGAYWSSTEFVGSPNIEAWLQIFSSGGGSFQLTLPKSEEFMVRCTRNLTT
ncbi:MAG: hypothetical protein HKM04_03390 [Legionellales bacterium]|nr:hypothetical protein [Legionellales bacterium]